VNEEKVQHCSVGKQEPVACPLDGASIRKTVPTARAVRKVSVGNTGGSAGRINGGRPKEKAVHGMGLP
jgi:hypothetical protein